MGSLSSNTNCPLVIIPFGHLGRNHKHATVPAKTHDILRLPQFHKPIKLPGKFDAINHPRTQMFIVLADLIELCRDILETFQTQLKPRLLQGGVIRNYQIYFPDGPGSELLPEMEQLLKGILGSREVDIVLEAMHKKIDHCFGRIGCLMGSGNGAMHNELFRPLIVELQDETSHILTSFDATNVENTLEYTCKNSRNRRHIFDICGSSVGECLEELLRSVRKFHKDPTRKPTLNSFAISQYEDTMNTMIHELTELYYWLLADDLVLAS